METRANYALIGAFALAGFLGLLLFLMLFANRALDRHMMFYDVRFQSVSGLSRASEVRFEGLPVGQVVDVRLAPEMDGTILVRLEVIEETPLRLDSTATISSLGVTGVSFVALSSGDPELPLLRDLAEIPEIAPARAVLDVVFDDGPAIVERALAIMDRITLFLGDDNVDRVTRILENLETSSEGLATAFDDFAALAASIAAASGDFAEFSARMVPVAETALGALSAVETTLEIYSHLALRAQASLDISDATLEAARAALETSDRFLSTELSALASDLTRTSEAVRSRIDTLGADAQALIAELSDAGREATARLREAQGTIAAADAMLLRLTATLDTVDGAAGRFEHLLAQDGAPLIAEARALIASATVAVDAVTRAAGQDLPAVMADVRQAAQTAAQTVETVGADLRAASGRVDGVLETAQGTLSQVGETFAQAGSTLDAINRALDVGERTLQAAERAFAGADRVINTEVGDMIADLRRAMRQLDAAISQVADDIPAVSESLRESAQIASAAFSELGAVVAAAAPPVRDFATQALPQFTAVGRETRSLIAGLERLMRQIERDPARFFLGRQTPEFRR